MAKKKQPNHAAGVRYVEKQEAMEPREKKAVIVERECDRIVARDGAVTPTTLVEEARKPTHPLHQFFEWDDGKAAEKYRIVQATQMILATKYVAVLQKQANAPPTVVHARPVRKLLPGFKGDGFKTRTTVLSEEETRASFIERKRSALKAWCHSVCDVIELDEIRGVIESWLEPAA